jgi:hypothetical protein
MNKFWRINYWGSHLGGRAIVMAPTAEEAIEALRPQVDEEEFTAVSAVEIAPENGVLYNWNGDY